jgi:hypothetical protein
MTHTIEIPQAIHHSAEIPEHGIGDTIFLFDGKGPGGKTLGTIWNAEDFGFPRQTEEINKMVVEFADKVVRTYNSHDALLAACEAHDTFDKHTSDCGNCEEFGPGNCEEGGKLLTEAYRLSRAALDKIKPKARSLHQKGADASDV